MQRYHQVIVAQFTLFDRFKLAIEMHRRNPLPAVQTLPQFRRPQRGDIRYHGLRITFPLRGFHRRSGSRPPQRLLQAEIRLHHALSRFAQRRGQFAEESARAEERGLRPAGRRPRGRPRDRPGFPAGEKNPQNYSFGSVRQILRRPADDSQRVDQELPAVGVAPVLPFRRRLPRSRRIDPAEPGQTSAAGNRFRRRGI